MFDTETIMAALKGAIYVVSMALFALGVKRLEKWFEARDIKPEKQQTELEKCREQIKVLWDEGHERELRLLVIVGVLAAFARRADGLIVDIENEMSDLRKVNPEIEFCWQETLDHLKEHLDGVNNLEELKK